MEKSLIKKHWYSTIFSTHRTIASVTNVCIIPFARSHFSCAFHLHQLLLKVNFISFSMQSRTQQKNFETKQNKNDNINKCQKIYCLQNSNAFYVLCAVDFLQGGFQFHRNCISIWCMFVGMLGCLLKLK